MVDRDKILSSLVDDVDEIKEYPTVDSFIDMYFQQSCHCGEYDDNSLELSYDYSMLSEIANDEHFMKRLKYVLHKYISPMYIQEIMNKHRKNF